MTKRVQKHAPPSSPELTPQAVEELEKQLRNAIDSWGRLQAEPEEEPLLKEGAFWVNWKAPGINKMVAAVKKSVGERFIHKHRTKKV